MDRSLKILVFFMLRVPIQLLRFFKSSGASMISPAASANTESGPANNRKVSMTTLMNNVLVMIDRFRVLWCLIGGFNRRDIFWAQKGQNNG